jgi:hypothetical protein
VIGQRSKVKGEREEYREQGAGSMELRVRSFENLPTSLKLRRAGPPPLFS